MITAKNILSAFYVSQGLKGKHLRKAMQSDMRSLRRQGGNRKNGHGGGIVNCGFPWDESKEGAMYWARRSLFYRTISESRQVN